MNSQERHSLAAVAHEPLSILTPAITLTETLVIVVQKNTVFDKWYNI